MISDTMLKKQELWKKLQHIVQIPLYEAFPKSKDFQVDPEIQISSNKGRISFEKDLVHACMNLDPETALIVPINYNTLISQQSKHIFINKDKPRKKVIEDKLASELLLQEKLRDEYYQNEGKLLETITGVAYEATNKPFWKKFMFSTVAEAIRQTDAAYPLSVTEYLDLEKDVIPMYSFERLEQKSNGEFGFDFSMTRRERTKFVRKEFSEKTNRERYYKRMTDSSRTVYVPNATLRSSQPMTFHYLPVEISDNPYTDLCGESFWIWRDCSTGKDISAKKEWSTQEILGFMLLEKEEKEHHEKRAKETYINASPFPRFDHETLHIYEAIRNQIFFMNPWGKYDHVSLRTQNHILFNAYVIGEIPLLQSNSSERK
ncbi:MAG: hypothetical protein WC916_00740 [Candidatus Woesearchaeota archaeon]